MDQSELYQPQRQSVSGTIFIFLQSVWKIFRITWALVLVYIVKGDASELIKGYWGLGGSILLIYFIVDAILSWRNFFFYIEDDQFILEQGYLKKKKTTIPLEKIVAVNIKQGMMHQVLDVVQLEIDSAGSKIKEIQIKALSEQIAEQLQKELESTHKTTSETEENLSDTTILHLNISDLLRVGIAQNHIKAFILFLAFGYNIYQDLQNVFDKEIANIGYQVTSQLDNSDIYFQLFFIVIILLLGILVSIIRVILRYFDLTVKQHEKTFTIKDYVGFHADKNSVFRGEFDFNHTGFEDFMEDIDVLKSVRRFCAGNIVKSLTPKLYLSSYVIYSNNSYDTFSTTKNQYTNFTEDTELSKESDKKLLWTNIYLNYQKSDSEIFRFRTKFNTLNKNVFSNLNLLVDDKERTISLDSDRKQNYVNQQIEWHYEHNDRITLSALADYKYDSFNNPNFYSASSNTFFDNLIPVVSSNQMDVFQGSEAVRNSFDTTLKVFSILKPRNQLHFSIGNLYRSERFDTNAHQNLNNSTNTHKLFPVWGHALRFKAGLGYSYLGPRPIPYSQWADPVHLADASVAVVWRNVELKLEATNILNRRWHDMELNFVSQWNPSAPTRLPQRHVVAGAPRTILATLKVHY